MFKLKSKQVFFENSSSTLDITHERFAKKFKSQRHNLPKLKKQKDTIDKNIEDLNKGSDYSLQYIQEKKAELLEKKDQLNDKIYSIENNIDEINYYDLVDDPLFDYYSNYGVKYDDGVIDINEENNDNKSFNSNSSSPNELDYIRDKNIKKHYKKKKKVVKRNPEKKNNNISVIDYFTKNNNTTEENDQTNTEKPSKKKFYDDYRYLVDPYFKKDKPTIDKLMKCDFCNGDRIHLSGEGLLVCNKCGEIEIIFVDNEKSSYNDPVPDKPGYPYKRINHFNEWLSQFQAKESTDIPTNVYEKIINELNKIKIYDMNTLNIDLVKELLKKIGLSQYYEHTPYIISKLTGRPPPNIPREKEEKMREMFKEIQEPFEKNRPEKRVNFLNYGFILRKFSELLELDDFIKYFPLLKSREKLRDQDNVWKKICAELNWEYIPTV